LLLAHRAVSDCSLRSLRLPTLAARAGSVTLGVDGQKQERSQ
jgi:hypothetical protein